MKLKLRIAKHKSPSRRRIRFSVIDLDKSDSYPANFVCVLPSPTALRYQYSYSSSFIPLFGDRSLEVAKALLTEALAEANDSEIKAEIKKRIKLLENRIRAKNL